MPQRRAPPVTGGCSLSRTFVSVCALGMSEIAWVGTPLHAGGVRQYDKLLWQCDAQEHEIRVGSVVCMEAPAGQLCYVGLAIGGW